jgi:hypothetical protein
MTSHTAKPIRIVPEEEFRMLTKGKHAVVGPHAKDRMSDSQRKVFKDDELVDIVNKGHPVRIVEQQNGRFALYFRIQEGYRKIIIALNCDMRIVTFMNVNELPRP